VSDAARDNLLAEARDFARRRPQGREDALRLHFWPAIARGLGVSPEALLGGPAASAAPAGFRFDVIDSPAFAAGDYRPRWVIKRVLVAGQPALVGGPRKSLKSSLLIDLAVSVGSGTPFLGSFDVPRPHRVAVLSGESGEPGVRPPVAAPEPEGALRPGDGQPPALAVGGRFGRARRHLGRGRRGGRARRRLRRQALGGEGHGADGRPRADG
jgi:hypothetical protein